MLEIGVAQGGSLALWRKFLGDEAVIFGIDIDPKCAAFDGSGGRVRIGSQDDPKFLRDVAAEMKGIDVVLDDGSHIGRHQRASFDVLFPLLSDGGIYIMAHPMICGHLEVGQSAGRLIVLRSKRARAV